MCTHKEQNSAPDITNLHWLVGRIRFTVCGVRGREVERRPHNHKVPSSIPGSGCQLWDFPWPTHSARVLVQYPGSRIERY